MPRRADGLPADRSAATILVAIGALLLTAAWMLGSVASRVAGGFDSTLSAFAIDHRSGALNSLMAVLTNFGSGAVAVIVAAIALLALYRVRAYRSMIAVLVVIAGELVIEYSTKLLVGRARPSGHTLVTATGSSFPSGHAMYAAAFFGILIVLALRDRGRPRWAKPAAVLCAVLAVLVGISRVYLGVHWPTDVLGSWLFGGAWAMAVAHLMVPPRESAALD